MVKAEYWEVSDAQVVEKTGQPLAHWMQLLHALNAENRKSTDVIAVLQKEHGVPRYWARTLHTRFVKMQAGEL